MELQVSPSPSPVLKREQNWGWTRTDPKVSILVNHIIRSLLNIQRNFFDSTMDKMKCFILFQSAVIYIVMSIKAHIPLLGSSKQSITYLFVYVLDFVFALTQNIFTFGFSHQKLANFALCQSGFCLSLIDLDWISRPTCQFACAS